MLDPALSTDPIAQDEWYAMLATNPNEYRIESRVTGSVTCVAPTYTPKDNCFVTASPFTYDSIIKEILHGLFAK